MKIRKFNENNNLESYTSIVRDNKYVTQDILSREIIEDYFSLIEPICNIDINLVNLISNNDNGFYISNVEENTFTNDENGDGFIAYHISMCIKDSTYPVTPVKFSIDNYESTDLYDINYLSKCKLLIDELKSISNKIKSHDHNIYINMTKFGSECIITNNKNYK